MSKNKTNDLVVLTDEQLDQIEELAGKLKSSQIADKFGISRATFYNIMQRQPEASRRYQMGCAVKLEKTSDQLFDIAMGETTKGNLSALIFWQKTRGGWAEAREEVVAENTTTEMQTEEEKQARLQEIKRYTAFKKYEAEFENFLKSKE